MISTKLVRERYQRMADTELVRFAASESNKLSIEAFYLLKEEFESRGLDLSVIQRTEDSRQNSKVTNASEFKKIATLELNEIIWKFTIDEKAKGKTNNEILFSLIKKGIKKEYAHILVESIEARIKELVESFSAEIIGGWISFSAGLSLLLFAIASHLPISFSAWGMVLLFNGVTRLVKYYRKRNYLNKIICNFDNGKENEKFLYQ